MLHIHNLCYNVWLDSLQNNWSISWDLKFRVTLWWLNFNLISGLILRWVVIKLFSIIFQTYILPMVLISSVNTTVLDALVVVFHLVVSQKWPNIQLKSINLIIECSDGAISYGDMKHISADDWPLTWKQPIFLHRHWRKHFVLHQIKRTTITMTT